MRFIVKVEMNHNLVLMLENKWVLLQMLTKSKPIMNVEPSTSIIRNRTFLIYNLSHRQASVFSVIQGIMNEMNE